MWMLAMSKASSPSAGCGLPGSCGAFPGSPCDCSRSLKLNVPSFSFTTFTFRPETRMPSTIAWPLSSGISLTEACAESSERKRSLALRSESVTPPTLAPRLGQKASARSPWSASVRPVFSFTSRSIRPL
jgi:hypothetical protein